jgi:hypothetical protein
VLLRKAVAWGYDETIYISLAEVLLTSPAGAMVARKTSIRSYRLSEILRLWVRAPRGAFLFALCGRSTCSFCSGTSAYLVRNAIGVVLVILSTFEVLVEVWALRTDSCSKPQLGT